MLYYDGKTGLTKYVGHFKNQYAENEWCQNQGIKENPMSLSSATNMITTSYRTNNGWETKRAVEIAPTGSITFHGSKEADKFKALADKLGCNSDLLSVLNKLGEMVLDAEDEKLKKKNPPPSDSVYEWAIGKDGLFYEPSNEQIGGVAAWTTDTRHIITFATRELAEKWLKDMVWAGYDLMREAHPIIVSKK